MEDGSQQDEHRGTGEISYPALLVLIGKYLDWCPDAGAGQVAVAVAPVCPGRDPDQLERAVNAIMALRAMRQAWGGSYDLDWDGARYTAVSREDGRTYSEDTPEDLQAILCGDPAVAP